MVGSSITLLHLYTTYSHTHIPTLMQTCIFLHSLTHSPVLLCILLNQVNNILTKNAMMKLWLSSTTTTTAKYRKGQFLIKAILFWQLHTNAYAKYIEIQAIYMYNSNFCIPLVRYLIILCNFQQQIFKINAKKKCFLIKIFCQTFYVHKQSC